MHLISIRKILQMLYYIQSRNKKQSDGNGQMYLLKLVYFADRHHLRHFGMTISNDTYYAMKKGPVAMGTFNILKKQMPRSANSAEENLLDQVIHIDEYQVKIKEQMDDELSESNKISLDFAISNFGNFDQFILSEISHTYPEWLKYKTQIEDGLRNEGKVAFKISPDDFFEDPKDISYLQRENINADPFYESDKDFLELMKESVNEASC